MTSLEKFLFDDCFDAERRRAQQRGQASAGAAGGGTSAAAEGTEAQAARFTDAELQQARAEGFEAGLKEGQAAGLQQGIEQAVGESQQAAALALPVIAERLSELAGEIAERAERRDREALGAALLAIEKLFPEFTRRHGMTEVTGVIKECLERLRDEPRIVVRVADPLLDSLREHIEPLVADTGFTGKVVLFAEPELASGDVRVEWADGGAERDGERTWRDIEEIVSRALGTQGWSPSEADLESPQPAPQDTEAPPGEPVEDIATGLAQPA